MAPSSWPRVRGWLGLWSLALLRLPLPAAAFLRSRAPNDGGGPDALAALGGPVALSAASAERAGTAAASAQQAAAAAAGFPVGSNADLPAMEAQAAAVFQRLVALRDQALALAAPLEQQAYAAARADAAAAVARAKTEASAYGGRLRAQMDAQSVPQVSPQQAAIEGAVRPYLDAGASMRAWAEKYHEQAYEITADVRNLVDKANGLAQRAAAEQATNATAAAKQHQQEARAAAATAVQKRHLARRLRRLADSANSAVPAYEQAAAVAADHISAAGVAGR